jgi:hypothetical protein
MPYYLGYVNETDSTINTLPLFGKKFRCWRGVSLLHCQANGLERLEMSIIHRLIGFMALAACLLFTVTSQAAGWSAPLVGGGEVRVDPRTNRATILRGGVETQLWDGAHRLQDGSTLVIHSGQAVPNAAILGSRRLPGQAERPGAEQWIGVPIVGYSPCERLVRRVCGLSQECGSAKACDPARQLLEMEQQERKANDSPNYMTHASGQCQEVDQDKTFFVSCGQKSMPGQAVLSPGLRGEVAGRQPPSACELLVDKVCGLQGACSAQTACHAAQQLLQMGQELSADQGGGTGSAVNPTQHQCVQALSDEGFFKSCSGP